MRVPFKNELCRSVLESVRPARPILVGRSGRLLLAVVFLLAVGIVSLAVLAKQGQFHPRSSFANQISKVSKMNECRSPVIGAVPPAMFPDVAAPHPHLNEPTWFLSTRETFIQRAPGFSQKNLSRPPPSLRPSPVSCFQLSA
jgi:hypothetical protein